VRRREFITLLGGAAAAWPLAARAQQTGKPPTIGFLGSGTPATHGQWAAAFVQRLRELGWVEGRTVAIEYRWAEGRNERYPEIAAEFVRLKVDVIVTVGAAALAAKQVTSVIPIVFWASIDPVGGIIGGRTISSTDCRAWRANWSAVPSQCSSPAAPVPRHSPPRPQQRPFRWCSRSVPTRSELA
jgi:hypothetical protein